MYVMLELRYIKRFYPVEIVLLEVGRDFYCCVKYSGIHRR